MIQSEAGYHCTRDALAQLERMLLSSFREKAEYAQNYALFTEPIVAELLKLRAELDEYIGLTHYLKTYGVPLTADELDALGPPADSLNRLTPAPEPAAATP